MIAMKTVRYLCAHCGRGFEAEEKDAVECPGCFWTSSVKKEEEARGQKETVMAAPSAVPAVEGKKGPARFVPAFVLLGLIVLSVAGGIVFLPHLKKNSQAFFKIQKPGREKIVKKPQAGPSSPGALLPGEKNVC